MFCRTKYQPTFDNLEQRQLMAASIIAPATALAVANLAQQRTMSFMSGPAIDYGTALTTSTTRSLIFDFTHTESVLTIQNTTGAVVYYQLQWPGGAWQDFNVQPGQSRYHWCDASNLTAQIRFDYSYAPGYQNRQYALGTLDFKAGGFLGRSPGVADGAQYKFKSNAGVTGLDLFSYNALDKTRYASYRASLENSSDFPRLMTNFEVLGPSSDAYNCIAWSLGVTNRWIWPETKISDFDRLDGQYGYHRLGALDLSVQAGYQKIALYGTRNADGSISCTHQALQSSDGTWTSKLGHNALIKHLTADAVGGGLYGEVVAVYVRRI